MSQPVKVSDDLLLDARLVAEVSKRSIAGQIELWASIGRALEPLLRGDKLLALCRAGAARPLSQCITEVTLSEGKTRLIEHLHSLPYPHFERDPDHPGLLIRIEADGTRTLGRFVNRSFQQCEMATK